jgi:hypothetical protein
MLSMKFARHHEELLMSHIDAILLTSLGGLALTVSRLVWSRLKVGIRDRQTMRAWTVYFHGSIGDAASAAAEAVVRDPAIGRAQRRRLADQRSNNCGRQSVEPADGARVTTVGHALRQTRTATGPC